MSDIDRPSVDDQVHKARIILKLNSNTPSYHDIKRDAQSKLAKAAFVIEKRNQTINELRAEIESLRAGAKEYRRQIFDLAEKLRFLRKAVRESKPEDDGLPEMR